MHKCIAAVANSLIADISAVIAVGNVVTTLLYRYFEGAAMPVEIPGVAGRHRHLLPTTYKPPYVEIV